MAIRPEEITNIIKEKIEKLDTSIDVNEVGTVIQVGDGIARVYGLNNVKASELVDFGHGVKGMALNLEYDNVGCVLMGPDTRVHEGDTVKRTGEVISIPVGTLKMRNQKKTSEGKMLATESVSLRSSFT